MKKTNRIFTTLIFIFLYAPMLVLILVLRKKKKKKIAEEEAQKQAEFDMAEFLKAAADSQMAGANAAAGADVMNIQSERSIELRHDIRKFAEDNPEIAAQMLRTWLRGDDDVV